MKVELLKEEAPQRSNLMSFPKNTLGIIRQWGKDSGDYRYIGRIVIWDEDTLYSLSDYLNKDITGCRWSQWVKTRESLSKSPNYIIDVLPAGTELKITI